MNGRKGRRVACVLANDGRNLEVFDMEEEEGDEEADDGDEDAEVGEQEEEEVDGE
jgi:anaphase-promoting complex subunit 4